MKIVKNIKLKNMNGKRLFFSIGCLMIALFINLSIFKLNVNAEEAALDTVEEIEVDGSEYVLQSGGMLNEEMNVSIDSPIMLLSLDMDSADAKGAASAIKAAWDNLESTCDISRYNIPLDDIGDLYFSVLNSSPEYFYVTSGYGASGSPITGCATNVRISYNYALSDITAMKIKYESAVNEAISGVNPNWSDMEKALYLHDYIVDNCEYDLTYSNYDAYNVFVDKTAVCQGYALAYKDLMNRVNIPCQVVTSDDICHAWNMIYINDNYYFVDATWDDPTFDTVGRVLHTNFLRSYVDFANSDHLENGVQDWVITENWYYGAAEDTTWDNSFFNNVDTGCRYLNGIWYAKEYDKINKYKCIGNDWISLGTFYTIRDRWYSSDGGTWRGIYSGLSMYNGLLYYATPTQVFSINPAVENSRVPAYTLTDEHKQYGEIYGMYVAANGDVRCEMKVKNPNVDGKVIVVCNVAANDPCVYGHDFSVVTDDDNHECSVCGTKEPHDKEAAGFRCSKCGYKQPIILKDMSLELDNDSAYIGVNLYLEAFNDVTIYLDGEALTYSDIFYAAATKDSTDVYKIQYRCSAKEFADKHRLTAVDSAGVLVEIEGYGSTYEFSGKTYCDNVLKPDSTASDKLKNVCSALMEYNAQARNYFGYNTEGLEVGAVSGYIPNYSDNAMAITGQLPEGYAYLGSSLVLEDKLVLRHYFSGNFGGSTVSFSNLSGKGTDVTINTVVMQESNLMYVDISAPYSCIDNMYRITIELSDDINRSYSYTLKYGALTYYLKARDLNVGKDLINTCQALYNYSLATQNYFSN